MELRRLLKSLSRLFWLMVLLGVIGIGVGFFIANSDKEVLYSADTTIYTLNKIKSPINGLGGINYQDILASRQLVNDYQQIIRSDKVITLVEKEVKDINLSVSDIKNMISISAQPNSSIVIISAYSKDPKVAKDVSTAVSKCFISTLNDLTDSNIVGIIDEAKVPNVPISSDYSFLGFGRQREIMSMVLGGSVGLILALILIIFIDSFDTTIRFYEDIEKYTDCRIIGIIPNHSIK